VLCKIDLRGHFEVYFADLKILKNCRGFDLFQCVPILTSLSFWLFPKYISSPLNYDLVINTGTLSIEKSVNAVIHAVNG